MGSRMRRHGTSGGLAAPPSQLAPGDPRQAGGKEGKAVPQASNPAAARVTTPPRAWSWGSPRAAGWCSGRGPDADLSDPRRAGPVPACRGDQRDWATGAWIANISRTHALYTEGDGYRIGLPRMEERDEPSSGWFCALRHGARRLPGDA